MPRASLSAEAVVELACCIVDERGAEALTLSAVAGRAGVATPSLYKHVRNLAELRDRLSERVLTELADRTAEAVLGRSGDEAVRAFLRAWRAYVLEHPQRYAAIRQDPGPQASPAGQRLLSISVAVLRAYGLEGSALIHATRCLRAAAHGFTVLEVSGGFAMDEQTGDSYELLIDMLLKGLPTASAVHTTGVDLECG
ncbi:TetR/AcrR family transcriptional regulator [Nonomuraea sp. KC401]|uniref:TetR/AcrR family transcriptional regulator n=1 Tax=unclassified Nonomuraea TaxID=2593643 RepID=UPI0010FDBEED|nr:TetR/AcrR family transcriptional regulator [Nonomuraea sp. KC401]NBE96567.1 TetR family transcriptional regulator [Nonomuraea sp. K271]TLF86331.1 TetR/AcrR family transcriptional regulator [Nonomuraea sp. KC401]